MRALLVGLGVEANRADQMIEDAVFEEMKWNHDVSTAQERLLFETRCLLARQHGGRLMARSEISGVPGQNKRAFLTPWLGGKKLEPSRGLSTKNSYDQIRALLVGLKMETAQIDLLIEEAIFEERGWNKDASAAQKRLLFEARRRVAREFGGRLPACSEMDGVPFQGNDNAPLSRWLNGKKIIYSPKLTPAFFYNQVRALLKHLEFEELELERWIEEAVFEERGWNKNQSTAGERLLLEARKVVAKHHGGRLPALGGKIAGVPPQSNKDLLTLWLNGETIRYTSSRTPQLFYDQVRALLTGLGIPEHEADSLIIAARREEE